MPQSNSASDAGPPDLHAQVEAKLIKVFGPERGAELLRRVLAQLTLASVNTTADLHRVAELLQTRSGFEGTVGAMLAVMAAVRQSQLR